jgi:phenylacetic acid degradation protein PaaD
MSGSISGAPSGEAEPGRTPAEALFAGDRSAALFGMQLVAATPEGSVVRMAVTPDMTNGVGVVHGGVVFLLADSAIGFASNAAGDRAVTASAEIDWLAPVAPGDVLTATATRRWSGGRSSLWDVGSPTVPARRSR